MVVGVRRPVLCGAEEKRLVTDATRRVVRPPRVMGRFASIGWASVGMCRVVVVMVTAMVQVLKVPVWWRLWGELLVRRLRCRLA